MCGKPAAIFWDIENINRNGSEGLQEIMTSIKRDLLKAKKLNVVQFTCVCAAKSYRLIEKFEATLVEEGIKIRIAPSDGPDAADLEIIELIDEFVSMYKDKSTIILITGDGDFIKRLVKYKDDFKITIYTVHFELKYANLLDAVSDETYVITGNGLKSITNQLDVIAVKVTGLPDNIDTEVVKSKLIDTFGYIGGSKEALYFDSVNRCYWINFECKDMAKLIVETKNGLLLFNVPLTVEYIEDAPEDVIRRLSELDIKKSVRNKKMNIIRTSIRYEYQQSWRQAKEPILSFKSGNMINCVLVTGIPGMFGKYTIENFHEKYFNVAVDMFWESNNSIAFHKMDDEHGMVELIEKINRSTIHPELKLEATLFRITDLPEIHKEKKSFAKLLHRWNKKYGNKLSKTDA